MSRHTAAILWVRGDAPFTGGDYGRAHEWRFDGGAVVRASASPSLVPPPHSHAEAVDPEEAFVAAIASCHMLWFLHLASDAGWIVDRYEDAATGVLGRNDEGRAAITRVTLRPAVSFTGTDQPAPDAVAALHHKAHQRCFLAASVRTEIVVEPVATED